MTNHITRDLHAPDVRANRRGSMGGYVRRLFQALRNEWQRRQAIAELQAMDNRSLRDMGIYRGDILRAVSGLADDERRRVPIAIPVQSHKEKAAAMRTVSA